MFNWTKLHVRVTKFLYFVSYYKISNMKIKLIIYRICITILVEMFWFDIIVHVLVSAFQVFQGCVERFSVLHWNLSMSHVEDFLGRKRSVEAWRICQRRQKTVPVQTLSGLQTESPSHRYCKQSETFVSYSAFHRWSPIKYFQYSNQLCSFVWNNKCRFLCNVKKVIMTFLVKTIFNVNTQVLKNNF